jgi:hypothetical protein
MCRVGGVQAQGEDAHGGGSRCEGVSACQWRRSVEVVQTVADRQVQDLMNITSRMLLSSGCSKCEITFAGCGCVCPVLHARSSRSFLVESCQSRTVPNSSLSCRFKRPP